MTHIRTGCGVSPKQSFNLDIVKRPCWRIPNGEICPLYYLAQSQLTAENFVSHRQFCFHVTLFIFAQLTEFKFAWCSTLKSPNPITVAPSPCCSWKPVDIKSHTCFGLHNCCIHEDYAQMIVSNSFSWCSTVKWGFLGKLLIQHHHCRLTYKHQMWLLNAQHLFESLKYTNSRQYSTGWLIPAFSTYHYWSDSEASYRDRHLVSSELR
jgi:hypothetical protein